MSDNRATKAATTRPDDFIDRPGGREPDLTPLPRRGFLCTVSKTKPRVLSECIVHDLSTQTGVAFAVVEMPDGLIKSVNAGQVRFVNPEAS